MCLVAYRIYNLAAIKHRYEYSAYSGVIIIILLLYPLMWISNGGISGSIPYFFVFISGIVAVLLNQIKYKLILMVQFILIVVLLVIDYKFPYIIVGYESELSRYLDIGVSLILISFLTFVMISKIMKEYHNNIEELERNHVELKTLNRKLEVISNTDDLTGIYNRRYIMNRLYEEIEKKPIKNDVSVIMIDIDHFKQVNDKYGHCAGDEVIRVISKTLKENIRSTDIVGRIGGEEFLILLPGVSLLDAEIRAEKLRTIIWMLDWEFEGLVVTISGGVYCREFMETMDEILDRVDEQLYKAKREGRNLIRSCG